MNKIKTKEELRAMRKQMFEEMEEKHDFGSDKGARKLATIAIVAEEML